MGQRSIILHDELSKSLRPLVSNVVSPQVHPDNHVAISKELTEFFHMGISEILILNINHTWLKDAPSLEGRGKALTHRGFFIELHLIKRPLLLHFLHPSSGHFHG